jgi:hypothetical protein
LTACVLDYTPIPMSMTNALDESMAADLQGRGYTIQPLLDQDDISALERLGAEVFPRAPKDYYATAFSEDVDAKLRFHQGILALVEDKVRRLLPDYQIVMSQLVTKRAKSLKGRLGLHQDYSFGDHSQRLILNLWAPFCDVDASNACLRVVPGSQALGHIAAIPPKPSPDDRYRSELTDFMVELPMSAGHAFVFDPRLLHSTEENQTDRDRTALFLNLVPRDTAPVIHVWNATAPSTLSVYEVTTEALTRLRPNVYPDRPEEYGLRYVRSIPYQFEETPREAIELLRPGHSLLT